MNRSYIQVIQGKNSFWRYLFVFLLSIISYSVIPAIALIAYAYFVLDGNPGIYVDVKPEKFIIVPPIQEHFIFHLSMLLVLFLIWLYVKFILKRSLRTLITRKVRIDWKKIFWSFQVFSLLFLFSMLVRYFLSPGDFSLYPFNLIDYVFVFLTTLFLTPLQTTLEELIFRGILLQWIGKTVKKPFILSLIIGGIFGGMHFANPEMNDSAIWVGIDYLFVGFMLTYIAAKTGSLELSIGAHAANNMWIYWLVTMDNTVAEGLPSLFYVSVSNPVPSVILDLFVFIILYLFIYKKYLKVQ